jgi:hypothetical protein
MLSLFMQGAAYAYTLILRDGRSLEIPAHFIVTRTTLTYEAAPGINITIQMSSINLEATEKANREPAGSLLRRAEPNLDQKQLTRTAAPPERQARRTVTNKDLLATRRTREQSEAAYERRLRELGLPSLEESRRRKAQEQERAREELRLSEEEDARAEDYWRARAGELRGRLVSLDAEINFLRARLIETPDTLSFSSFTVITSAAPFLPLRPSFGASRRGVAGQRQIYASPVHGALLSGRASFGGGSTRGRVFLNSGPRAPFARHTFPLPHGALYPYAPLAATTFPGYLPSYDYERGALLARIQELEAERAGLQARWRLLEDEARRAGAQPGWLRP